MDETWQLGFGASVGQGGTRFRVWAHGHARVDVVLADGRTFALTREPDGWFAGEAEGVGAGDRYRFRLDGGASYPDPASRSQPDGVHGASEVVDPRAYEWRDEGWAGVRLEDAVIYELHVGTFTPPGTFDAIIPRLGALHTLGITLIELMPVAQFAGGRNWGYDGVFPYAPAREYGGPEALRRLVDAAHRVGLGVVLDVVCNHLGPEGNCLYAITSGRIFTDRHTTPWGHAINFDDDGSRHVRVFFIENALYWLHEYHIDGLRLDATHTMRDDSEPHILDELAARVRSAAPRPVLLMAEDERNERRLILPREQGGYGFDAVWADDLHHQLRRYAAGDQEGYYRAYSGSLHDVAETLRKGWLYEGQWSEHKSAPRGTPAAELPTPAFIHFLQNHDQVGNRALGERLNHQVPLPVYRALNALLLLSPYTPLLFMGQEWAASAPFLFFTDLPEPLGQLVTAGRREEFSGFRAFASEAARSRIPDPQAASTFLESKPDWEERDRPPHRGVLGLFEELLTLRRTHPAMRSREREHFDVAAVTDDALVLRRHSPDGDALLLVTSFEGGLALDLNADKLTRPPAGRGWALELATEEERYGGQGRWGALTGSRLVLHDAGAAVLRTTDVPARGGT